MYTPGPLSFDEFPVGCMVTDDSRRILYSNQYMSDQYGYAFETLQNRDLFELFSKASQVLIETFVAPALARDGQCEEIRLSLVPPSQKSQPVIMSVVADSANARLFWSIANANRSEQMFIELKKTQQLLEQKVTQLRALSSVDPLTGLPNRAALSRHLDRQIAALGGGFALAFIDLDGFKEINDRYGHETGDKVLQHVAKRLTDTLRHKDMVARFGGDEFVVVLDGYFDQALAQSPLYRLIDRLAEPVFVNDVSLIFSASIGLTLYPQAKALEPDQLIRQADQAMYQAKVAGKNRVCFFDIDDEEVQKERHAELVAIDRAMAAGEFVLFYQPKINMRTGRVVGAEALIRWHHPARGLVGPQEFLPVLSNTPNGVRLGYWVIRQALAQLSAWQSQGLETVVSVNIDGYHFQHPWFLQELGTILADFPEVAKRCLELEVLETSAIDDIDQVALVISACRALGLQVSLDDFGTGYSSLSHLKELPVDTLKIDRSFVQNMLESRGDLAILKGVIGFAQAFEFGVIAEGVETLEHSRALLELGCEIGQGYFIARPMPASHFPGWVAAWARDAFQRKYGD